MGKCRKLSDSVFEAIQWDGTLRSLNTEVMGFIKVGQATYCNDPRSAEITLSKGSKFSLLPGDYIIKGKTDFLVRHIYEFAENYIAERGL